MAEKQEQKTQKIKERQGTKNISLELKRSTFSALFHLFSSEDLFEEVSKVRSLLSNERAKILHTIKESSPKSVYVLAKLLGRDFKSVRKDVSLLEHFGIIRLEKSSGKRPSLKPILALDKLQINISF